MKLYHGTSTRFHMATLKQGLRPRRQRSSNWKENPSRPDMVYLTTAYPFYYATRGHDDPTIVVYEIDSKKLDEARLYPDEDFVGELVRIQGGDMPTEAQKRAIRENLEAFQNMWPKSLAALGNCAYRGTIPPKAITRYCLFDYAARPELTFCCMDALINVLNYRFQGDELEKLVAWFFGDRKLLPMVDDAETEKDRKLWVAQSKDRTGIEVVAVMRKTHLQ